MWVTLIRRRADAGSRRTQDMRLMRLTLKASWHPQRCMRRQPADTRMRRAAGAVVHSASLRSAAPCVRVAPADAAPVTHVAAGLPARVPPPPSLSASLPLFLFLMLYHLLSEDGKA